MFHSMLQIQILLQREKIQYNERNDLNTLNTNLVWQYKPCKINPFPQHRLLLFLIFYQVSFKDKHMLSQAID